MAEEDKRTSTGGLTLEIGKAYWTDDSEIAFVMFHTPEEYEFCQWHTINFERDGTWARYGSYSSHGHAGRDEDFGTLVRPLTSAETEEIENLIYGTLKPEEISMDTLTLLPETIETADQTFLLNIHQDFYCEVMGAFQLLKLPVYGGNYLQCVNLIETVFSSSDKLADKTMQYYKNKKDNKSGE
jgi:hypothetical protein